MADKKRSFQSRFNSWVMASRPKTLPAAVAPVIVGSALAISKSKFVPVYSLIALACSLLIQIGTNFANDLYDYLRGADTKERKGPVRVLASGLISVKEMKAGVFVVFLTAFLLGLYLVKAAGVVILIIGVASIAAGIAYTAGPFPLAYHGLGDLFVFTFFGLIGTMGTYYLHTHEFSFLAFLTSVPIGALVTNILVVNNYRDIEEDKASGKNTLAVLIGKNLTRYQYVILTVLSFLVPAILFKWFGYSAWIFLPYLTIPIAYKTMVMLKTLEGRQLNKTLELTAKLSALYGLLFAVGLVL
ncbi:MAG: 1,4-dihydroxy-2-naphthoate polyprenyltransferase [Candidatus Kryptoniota bacterium]